MLLFVLSTNSENEECGAQKRQEEEETDDGGDRQAGGQPEPETRGGAHTAQIRQQGGSCRLTRLVVFFLFTTCSLLSHFLTIRRTELKLETLTDQVEEVTNGVEVLTVEDGEQEEGTQPRVTKAQKRRVRRSNPEIWSQQQKRQRTFFQFLKSVFTKETSLI